MLKSKVKKLDLWEELLVSISENTNVLDWRILDDRKQECNTLLEFWGQPLVQK